MAAANSVNQGEFFTYDANGLLKAADRGDLNGGKTAISTLTFGQDWDQDQLGNWSNFTQDNDGNGTNELSQGRTHNDVNEITQVDSSATHVAHDAAGNMTKVPSPTSWSAHYDLTWDAWNRLVKVVDGANTVAEYQHDGINRRIVKKLYNGGSLSQTRHIYLSNQNQVLEERVDSSTMAERQFTWGSRYIDDLILRTRDTDANGSLDETVYSLQDANWNITALADASGAVIERFVYTPYGQSTVLDANFATDSDGVSDIAWEYGFTSREFDSETDLHFFRARYYHDGLGRFIGRDPLEYVDGMSLYRAYFAPNSLDPNGLGIIPIYPNGPYNPIPACPRPSCEGIDWTTQCCVNNKIEGKSGIWICTRRLNNPRSWWPKVGPVQHSFVCCDPPPGHTGSNKIPRCFGKQPGRTADCNGSTITGKGKDDDAGKMFGPGWIQRENYHDFSSCTLKVVCNSEKARMCQSGPTEDPYYIGGTSMNPLFPGSNCHDWANGVTK